MTHTTATGSMPKNLQLSRELIAHLISETHTLHCENRHIAQLMDAGDEYELILLPGEDLEAILDNLKIIVRLASEPVPMNTTGHGRESDRNEVADQRNQIRLDCLPW